MKYFKNITNLDEARKRYKELAKKYHPDINPGHEKTMQEINREFEELEITFRNLPFIKSKENYSKKVQIKSEYKTNIINNASAIIENTVKNTLENLFDKYFVEK